MVMGILVIMRKDYLPDNIFGSQAMLIMLESGQNILFHRVKLLVQKMKTSCIVKVENSFFLDSSDAETPITYSVIGLHCNTVSGKTHCLSEWRITAPPFSGASVCSSLS